MPPALAACYAPALLAEVQEMLQGLEAAIGSASSSGAVPGLPDWARASILNAYRLCVGCAQMSGDIGKTLQVRDGGGTSTS